MDARQQEIIDEAEKVAREEIERHGLPLLVHFEATNKKGFELAWALRADVFVVGLGTRLMDLKFGEAFSNGVLKDHVSMSAKAAGELLGKSDIAEEALTKVLNCIEGHHRQIPWTCPEAEICANADCYRFLNCRNWLEFLYSLAGRDDMSFRDALQLAEEKFREKLGILTLDICKEELKEDIRLIEEVIGKARFS